MIKVEAIYKDLVKREYQDYVFVTNQVISPGSVYTALHARLNDNGSMQIAWNKCLVNQLATNARAGAAQKVLRTNEIPKELMKLIQEEIDNANNKKQEKS